MLLGIKRRRVCAAWIVPERRIELAQLVGTVLHNIRAQQKFGRRSFVGATDPSKFVFNFGLPLIEVRLREFYLRLEARFVVHVEPSETTTKCALRPKPLSQRLSLHCEPLPTRSRARNAANQDRYRPSRHRTALADSLELGVSHRAA